MNKFFNKQKGCNNTQITEQNNYGLSVAQATEMAFAIFREYYPQLRAEALEELNQLVIEKLSNIPEENIVPPNARIAVPTLQNASITEDPDVRELYANLLANSMNRIVKNGIHPSYVDIINQLTPDEAKILNYLYKNKLVPTIGLKVNKTTGGYLEVLHSFTNIAELCGCEDTNNYERHITNLTRLGLVKIPDGESLTDKSKYEALKNHPYITGQKRHLETLDQVSTVEYTEGHIELTVFGINFCSCCLEIHQVVVEKI